MKPMSLRKCQNYYLVKLFFKFWIGELEEFN